MRLSRGDDLISPTVKLSSLKPHLLSSFSSHPHSFSSFFAISLSHSHFPCSCHVGPASSAVLPRPFPVFLSSFLFCPRHSFSPSLPLSSGHTSRSSILGEQKERAGQRCRSPRQCRRSFIFSWCDLRDPLTCHCLLSLLSCEFLFFYSLSQKNLNLSFIASPPLLQQRLVWSMKHFPDSPQKCWTRSLWDFQQHPSFVFCLVSAGFYQSTALRLEECADLYLLLLRKSKKWLMVRERPFRVYWYVILKPASYYPFPTCLFLCLLPEYCTTLTLHWVLRQESLDERVNKSSI